MKENEKTAIMAEPGFKAGFESIRVRSSELELWSALATRTTSESGAVTACPWNVQTGASTVGSGLATTKTKVWRSDLVHFDFAISYEGYFPAIARNALVGPPTSQMKIIQNMALDLQMNTTKATRPDVAAEPVDRAARDAIAEKGRGPEFTHRLGHGSRAS